ncbi:MAG: tetratricopeptide repeat protein, partial [Elusimicrobia bacterium]|nr:tetratricopeptide repeat protein [Elusimicrobiota bacterium]
EAQGKHEAALQNYRRLVDEFGDHFLAPQAHLGIGRCLQMQGKNREAAEVYQKIPLLYPETAWAQTAQQLLGQKK